MNKMSSKDLLARRNRISSDFKETTEYLDKGIAESKRVCNTIANTSQILDDLDQQFKEQTGLTDTDVAFLFLAIGLQIARQYLISNQTFRLTASQGDKVVDNMLQLAPPDWRDVLTQSVPYDIIATGEHTSNTGLAGTTHRYRTLGHDPLLGWVFGTANIMTSSLTKTNLETYQVNMKTKQIIRHYPLGAAGMLDKAVSYGTNDPMLFAVSVARQAVHLGSDYFTKQGLPVPMLSMVDDTLVRKMLTVWHIDSYSIARGATLSSFINMLIGCIHGLFFAGGDEMQQKLYQVRTRKILLYSNIVATSSNAIVVAATGNLEKLDVGGAAVTIYRLITDTKFIREIKKEFIFGSYNAMIMGSSDYLYQGK